MQISTSEFLYIEEENKWLKTRRRKVEGQGSGKNMKKVYDLIVHIQIL